MRALIIAELCNPEWVSVPLVGWNHVRALQRVVDVDLVTHSRNAAALERAGVKFTAFDAGLVERALNGAIAVLPGEHWTADAAVFALAYYRFESQVWRAFGRDIEAGRWDVVHRLTPLSPTVQSLIASRCAEAGVPFVLGPLNGGTPWPPGFNGTRRRERGEFLSHVRDLYRLLPYYASTRDAASAITCGSFDVVRQLGGRWKDKAIYEPENGIDAAEFGEPLDPAPGPPLRVAFIGRLVAYKCADLLLEAAAPLVREGRVQVDVLGDGPEMPRLREVVAREKLQGGVTLHGWVKHARLREVLRDAHVLGFPSVREFGGGVVLEAMALGMAPVVVNYGGPGELVTEDTGFRVPLGTRDGILRGFRDVLGRLARDPQLVREVGLRARERALRHFTWEAKAAQTLEVYRWALGLRDKPDFGLV